MLDEEKIFMNMLQDALGRNYAADAANGFESQKKDEITLWP